MQEGSRQTLKWMEEFYHSNVKEVLNAGSECDLAGSAVFKGKCGRECKRIYGDFKRQ